MEKKLGMNKIANDKAEKVISKIYKLTFCTYLQISLEHNLKFPFRIPLCTEIRNRIKIEIVERL